ncbi:MAG TPA: hypothetical protein VHO03_11660 [Ignavibacteriales bacterium]|nr:hypothetical protein [Ignavibacteriales bacterium]
MLIRYFYEAAVGAIAVTLILLFGMKGLASLALLAFLPMYLRSRHFQPGERELSLFYKAGNLTLGIVLISVFVIYRFSETAIQGRTIGQSWAGLLTALIVFFHGLSGIIMNRFN